MVLILLASVTALLLIVLIIRSEYEKRQLEVTRYEMVSEKIPPSFDGARIVFLSDLHETTFGPENAKLILAVKDLHADLVLFGGDMVRAKKHGAPDFRSLTSLLTGIQEETVVYGTGNHESKMAETKDRYPEETKRFETLLQAHCVTRPENGTFVVSRGKDSIRILDVELPMTCYEKGPKKPASMPLIPAERIDRETFNIAMVHSPLYMEEAVRSGADLVLSGHFHGGTIYLGRLGGLMTPQLGFFEKRVRGMFHYGAGVGIVSAGLGTHSIKIRLNNKPEIVCITLRRAK